MRLLLLAATAVFGLAACGKCDGAIREMGPASGTIAADETFDLLGDGPGEEDSQTLLDLAGIDEDTWFLVDGAGAPVAATRTADSGGHICRNGNMFHLAPDAPLAAGDYTLVLLGAIDWPLLADTEDYEGQDALVRSYTVE